tara:strand:+ start:1463 stop:1720 length:258 start_codon:yes stop_codon:yes gene_type:complete
MNRETLINNLQNHVLEVTFTKVDGTERIMNCTLQEHMIPETSENNRKKNDEVLPVWDLDRINWRSFRIDSITNIKRFSYSDNGVL